MMTGDITSAGRRKGRKSVRPRLKAARIGIVSRDYRHKFKNGVRDFSDVWPRVLALLDEKGCDTVLFSLFSIVPQNSFRPLTRMRHLRHIKSVLYEEFNRSFRKGRWKSTGKKLADDPYVVLNRQAAGWKEYRLEQKFGSLTGKTKEEIRAFVGEEMPGRILGNCCVLLCGESNGVNYSRQKKSVRDDFGVRSAIPADVNIILNPVHDRMTRFEMKLKRAFLSENERWVISVWNKGKVDKNGKVKDGKRPAWTVFYSGEEKEVKSIPNQLEVEIGILDIVER